MSYPLIDLHRHLEGNVRLQTIIDLATEHKVELPAWDVATLSPYAQVLEPVPDLLSFLVKFDYARKVMVDYKAIKRMTRENLEDAVKEGINYIELRFSPFFMAELCGLDTLKVTEAICETFEETLATLPILANLIVVMSRTYGPGKCLEELEAAIAFKEHIVALDLAGDEANFPGNWFVEHFSKAKKAGLNLIAHAGEAAGFESVLQAIEELEVKRIGHGVAAINDEKTMEILLEKNIAVESCPTSNVQTSTVASYQTHPLPVFLEKGILATLNTDDPGISNIDLNYEYKIAVEKMGLTPEQIQQLKKNALQAAFLPQIKKDELMQKVTQK